MKAQILPTAYTTLQDLPCPLPALTSSVSSWLTLLQPQESSSLFQHARHGPVPGPLHLLCPLPGTPLSSLCGSFPHFPQLFVQMSPPLTTSSLFPAFFFSLALSITRHIRYFTNFVSHLSPQLECPLLEGRGSGLPPDPRCSVPGTQGVLRTSLVKE